MKKAAISAIVFALALAPGQTMTAKATLTARPTSDAANIAAIRAVGKRWSELYAAGRYQEIPLLYTSDTMVMPRGRPRIEGRHQMRRSVGGLAAGRKVAIQVQEREIQLLGRFAWVISDFTVRYGADRSAKPGDSGRSLILFRHDRDGQWRIHRDIDSPGPVSEIAAAVPTASVDMQSTTSSPPIWDPKSRTVATACDRLASGKYDRERLAPSVARESIDVPTAIATCEADLALLPNDPRINFHLGRLYAYAGNKQRSLMHRQAAAAVGDTNAIFLLGYLDWAAAQDDRARCTAAEQMRLAADRGNYSARITYASYFLERKFSACPNVATSAQVAAFLASAHPAVDGFFETRFAEHLQTELNAKGASR